MNTNKWGPATPMRGEIPYSPCFVEPGKASPPPPTMERNCWHLLSCMGLQWLPAFTSAAPKPIAPTGLCTSELAGLHHCHTWAWISSHQPQPLPYPGLEQWLASSSAVTGPMVDVGIFLHHGEAHISCQLSPPPAWSSCQCPLQPEAAAVSTATELE